MNSKIKIPEYDHTIQTIEFPENISLPELRKRLSEIDFSKPAIYVLLIPPGVGKTHTIKQYLKELNSFLLITSSHELLEGEYKGLGAKHWEGFSRKCEKYSKAEKLKDHGLSYWMICKIMGCDQSKCKYKTQFNTRKAIAPYQFLKYSHVLGKKGKNKNKFKFSSLIVDESILQWREIEINEKEIGKAFDAINKYRYADSFKKYVLNGIKDKMSFLYLAYETMAEINEHKNRALMAAAYDKEWDDVQAISKLNLPEIQKYCYYKQIYDEGPFNEPIIYDVFDIARQGVPVVLLDATFDKEAFDILLERYINENKIIPRNFLVKPKLGSIKDIKVKIFKADLQNKDITIYKMDKDNYYWKSAFFLINNGKLGEISPNGFKAIERLRNFIIGLKKKYHKVGIITYKKLKPHFNDLGPTEYFFNVRGSNKMNNVKALVIIGTPQATTKSTLTEYNNLCLTEFKEEEVYKQTYQDADGKYLIHDPVEDRTYKDMVYDHKKPLPLRQLDYDTYENRNELINQLYFHGCVDAHVYYPLESFYDNKCESEKYQTVHRARFFRYGDPPAVFIFGDVPDQVHKEFTVKYKTRNETNWFITDLYDGIFPLALCTSIRRYNEENELFTSLQIAKGLSLYKDKDKSSGYNSKFVTSIVSGKVNGKLFGLINSAVIKGLDTAKSIKKEYKELKSVDDEFLEYCIYYSKYGDFIKYIL